MSYIYDNLSPGENIVYEAKIHNFYIYRNAIITGTIGFILLFIHIVPAIIIFLFTIYFFIYNKKVEIGVTNKRLYLKTGLIGVSLFELQLNKVESVSFEKGVFDRMIGAGKITFTGTGGKSKFLQAVKDPEKLKESVYEQMERN